jgi:TonB-linked SusC/RagA family outer membrane protein
MEQKIKAPFQRFDGLKKGYTYLKFFFNVIILSFCTFSYSSAQTVSGTVFDQAGIALQGATVTVKNTSKATASDANGMYRIEAGDSAILIFSAVGFGSKQVSVSGNKTINITLTLTKNSLDEVVVTALGIKRATRSLGYSTTTVKPDELTVNRTSNPINALQGKVAGLNISSLGTGPGGSSKVRIRGQSTISGGGTPLIVINGVPIDNSNFNSNTNGVKGGGAFADGGDGFSSINPDDIETMTVLKSGPAAALYGSRARDGVIVITTKTKGKGKGLGVTYNVNATSETPLDFTNYQKLYGQGEGGIRPTTINPTSGQWSFGELITPGLTHTLYNTPNLPYVAQGSRIKEFYANAQNITNTVTLSSAGENGGIHLSLTSTNNKGIVPNNKFSKKGINLGFSQTLSSKLSITGSINYTNEINTNPPNIANQDNSIPTTLMALANTFPLSVLEANKINPATGNEFIYSRFQNRTNPYWVLSEQFHNIKRDRIYGNVSARYNLTSWLYVQGRFGQDYWSRDEDVNNFPTGHASKPSAVSGFFNGIFTQESRRYRETNLDYLIGANKEFGNLDISTTVGANQLRRTIDINNVQVTDFVVRGLYTVGNGRAKDPTYDLATEGVNSLYGSAEISWNRTFYMNITARNDWFSTLPPENRSILYPSISGAYIFSEHLKTSWLNFGKIRAGYAEVGSDGSVGPFSNQLFFGPAPNTVLNPNGIAVSVGGTGNTLPNPALRPEKIIEKEFGLELKMFKNRLNLEVVLYNKTTIDQIVPAQISDASGFTNTRINSGKSKNDGVEVVLNIVPVKTKNFNWEFIANTAYNKTKVLSIITNNPGERITVGTHVFNGEVRQVVGEELGQLAGFGYATDAVKGNQRIFQANNGIPLRTSQFMLFGSALPKWTGGFLNNFKYKGISLSVFIDYKLGNKVLSGTNFNAIRHGLHMKTLEGRNGGVVGIGVNQSGVVNTVAAAVQPYWEHLRTQQIIEDVIYNGGYWKLRQLSLGYDLTKFIPTKWPIKGIKLDLVANNVFTLKKWIDNIDPESFGFGADSQVGLESPGIPTTRSIGINLNIKF